MTVRVPATRLSLPMLCARCAVILGASLPAGVSTAGELPALRDGLWEISRTIEAPTDAGKPQTLQSRECFSPNAHMKKQQEMLQAIGCKFSPVVHAGNTYTFTADCDPDTSGTSRSVLTVESDSVYSIRIESNIGGSESQELLRATRIGDCPP